MRSAQGGEIADQPVEGMRRIEMVRARRAGCIQYRIIEVARRPRWEHVFARVGVVTIAHKALLVTIIDHWRTAQGHQHDMGEPHARFEFVSRNAGPIMPDQRGETAHVVVAEECRHGERCGLTAFVEDITFEEIGQHAGAPALPQCRTDRSLEREIEHGGIAVAPGELRDVAIARLLARHFAEDREVGNAPRMGRLQHGRDERLPEARVDMPRRVDAVAVDAEVFDPLPVDSDHPLAHAGVFGEQIIQTDEITEAAALAGEGRVAAVVIEQRIIEPVRYLDVLFSRGNERRVGKGRIGELREIGRGGILIARKAGIDRGARCAAPPRIGIVGATSCGEYYFLITKDRLTQ